jgi:hypothetical protein
MPGFKQPQYSKVINSKTNMQEPCYVFNIEFNDNDTTLSFIAESDEDISLQSLQYTVQNNVDWWSVFIGKFLDSSKKLFSKPYTTEHINKIAKHTLNGIKPDNYPVNVNVFPKSIQIMSGVFTVNWIYNIEELLIDIPDVVETEVANDIIQTSPVSAIHAEVGEKQEGHEIEELNIDDLPVNKNSTDEEIKISSPTKFYDKQRVKEARLKAKLAIYKAQRHMIQYSEKYGSDVSDSEIDTDSDYETSGVESESENHEIVQL